jgi:hypothetical protein
MQANLAEQQNKDWERIKYRKEEYERKRQELRERNELEHNEEIQREERLQALADRVRPHVEPSYARILQPTKVNQFLLITNPYLYSHFRHIMLIVVY